MHKAALVILALMIFGCGNEPERNLKGKFDVGQIVASAINGQRGQIVSEIFGLKEYQVRFSSMQGAYDANGGFLHGADEVKSTPFVLIRMKEFELRDVND